jgi:hypothetical protein
MRRRFILFAASTVLIAAAVTGIRLGASRLGLHSPVGGAAVQLPANPGRAIFQYCATALMRSSLANGGNGYNKYSSFTEMWPSLKSQTHPVWLTDASFVDRQDLHEIVAPGSSVYEVTPGWVVVINLSSARDYFTLMVVDHRDRAAGSHPAVWAEMGREPGAGTPTQEGTCRGLDYRTCVGKPAHAGRK